MTIREFFSTLPGITLLKEPKVLYGVKGDVSLIDGRL